MSTIASETLSKISERRAVCGILGLGYVGLPLAVEMVRAGFHVIGFDISENVVRTLGNGESHIDDVTSDAVSQMVTTGMFEPTTDMSRLAECDAISICVPTPLSKTRDPDVSYVVAATSSAAASLRPGQLLILESTTYPGTTRELMLPMLEGNGLKVGEDFFVCFSPERVDPGNKKWGVRNTPKVIGGVTPACLEIGSALYGAVMDTVVPVSSTEAAELTKLLENTFRAVNIALVNEIAQAADRLGINVWEVIEAAASKPFGYMKFTPGPGIGGHCIPLDPHYLAWKMKTLNYKTRLIELAGEINSGMPHFVLDKVRDALNVHRKALNGAKILILGVAYKKDVDDLRESPALDVIRLLEEKGAEVSFHDPHVAEIREEGYVRRSVELTRQELGAADCVVIVTDHSDVDYEEVVRAAALVVDTRNAAAGLKSDNLIGLSGTGAAQSVLSETIV